MTAWFNVDAIYRLNEEIRAKKVILLGDYVVAYGVPDEWIEVANVKEKELIFKVEFELLNDIELVIKEVSIYPGCDGFEIFNKFMHSLVEG